MMITFLPGWTEALIWIVVACFFAAAETFTMSFFLMFFAGGAVVAALTAFMFNEIVQVIVFIIATVVLIAFARPVIKKFIEKNKDPIPTNVYNVIGAKAIVLRPVSQIKGKVKIMNTGETWSAYTYEHYDPITEDTQVIIKEVDGAKVIVIPKSAADAEEKKR